MMEPSSTTNRDAPHESESSARQVNELEPRGPQFSLRTLLLAFLLISLLTPLAMRLGPIWSVALGWLGLLLIAHVLGNAWGTRATRRMSQHDRNEPALDIPTPPIGPIRYAPATRLERSTRPGWLTLLLTALGAVLGAAAGAVLLIVGYGASQAYTGIALGVGCAAALGGFFGFLSATSIGMSYRAWQDAIHHDHTPRTPPAQRS